MTYRPFFRRACTLLACLGLLAPGLARASDATPPAATPAAASAMPVATAAAAASAMSEGLDLSNLDPTCPACTDFYRFADGKYDANHPIPADRAEFGNFDALSDHQLDVLHGILDDVAEHDASGPPSDAQKLGTFYAACTDTAGRDAAGLTPLAPELAQIAAIHDVPSLVAELASLAKLNVDVVYAFGSEPDPKHSERTIGGLADGSLGLPEREYYLRTDAKSVKERGDYERFVGSYLALAGSNAATPSAAPTLSALAGDATPAQLLAFETALAKLQPTREQRRDPIANYHYVTFASLQRYAPGIDWESYFSALGAPPMTRLDVARPDYVIAATKLLTSTPLPTLRTYLRFRLLAKFAPQLPTAYDEASFAFYGTELTGAAKHRPQWQRCAFAAQGDMQDIVSVVYAQKAFTPAAKARALALVTNVHAALRDDLKTLAWMEPQTRARAARKLAGMVKKIGYPDHPLDYSALVLTSGPYAQQVLATDRFASATDVARIGKPTDRRLWGMSAPEVNAYYDPSNNEIVFPAGILGHPFFDPTADDAVNYGGIGAVMGHETTHGFDDEGRQYDERGDLSDWWQPKDAAAFTSRSACIVSQFSSYRIAGVHLNGSAVQGEAIADLGGLTLAYRAFEKTAEAKAGVKIGGYTPEQRFFLSFAQVWAVNQRDAAARDQALTDPHPVAMWRVIGTLSNMPEFQKAFHCKAIDAMVRRDRCRIW